MKIRAILISLLLLGMWACQKPQTLTLSPDGKVGAQLLLDEDGSVGFTLSVDGKELVRVARIGLEVRGNADMSSRFELVSSGTTRCDSVWSRPWGPNKQVREHYEGHDYLLKNPDGAELRLHIKVFDDGAAYRYEIYSGPQKHIILNETTEYTFPQDGTCWSIPANFESYEMAYREQPISSTTDANTPFTFRLENGLWGSIHEAGLKDMPEMTLRQISGLRFGVWLCPDNTGSGSAAVAEDTIRMAARTIQVGRKAVDLINSDLLENCNHGSRLQETGWIRPMKYIGIWWGMHLGINSWVPDSRHGATTQNAMRYIDFAARNGIDAVLLEGWNTGWEQWGGSQVFGFCEAAPDMDIEKVIGYAREKGVEIIIHHETGGNIPWYEENLEQAFRWCEAHGVHYVKTGYAGGFPDKELHHSQYGVRHYQKVVECAARHKVMLDVHEPIKFTGLCREYPNLMTGEGGRGMEWNAWSEGNPPSHHTILPFTRLLSGGMDYTPGVFDITYECLKGRNDVRQWNQMDSRKCRVHTTLAHQAALWVVIYSPWQMACDLIENYEGHPMFQFFRDYNPDCDWSRALMGEPGQYYVAARRAGEEYYIGAVTDEEARELQVPLDFLPEGRFSAVVYHDGPEADFETRPTDWQIDTLSVTNKVPLQLRLARGGGAAVRIIKNES